MPVYAKARTENHDLFYVVQMVPIVLCVRFFFHFVSFDFVRCGFELWPSIFVRYRSSPFAAAACVFDLFHIIIRIYRVNVRF